MPINQGRDEDGEGRPGVRYVAPLRAFGRNDVPTVGGKAANLGELIRSGMPVPDGYVLTTAAYRAHLWAGDAQREIAALGSGRSRDGAAVRRAILAADIPPEVAGAVLTAYRELGGGPVAVRSSATTEDLPTAAFAGQQETYLDVAGADRLLTAVRDCWASLWGERAIDYRQRQGFADQPVEIAVVVQRMVAAEAAGVLFTANPVTGARGECVLDAAPGLGEAVVSGAVAPDHYVLAKRGRRLTAYRRGDAGGPNPRRLTRREVIGLVRLGTAIERIFGTPQDVEWAVAGGRSYVLQARQLTALPEAPSRPARFAPSARGAEVATRMTRMVRLMVAELAPIRPYPMDDTTWCTAVLGALGEMAAFLGVRLPTFDELCTRDDGVIVRIDPIVPRPTPRLLIGPAAVLVNAVRYDPLTWRQDPAIRRVPAIAQAWESRSLPGMTPPALLDLLDEALRLPARGIRDLRLRYLPRGAVAALALTLVAKLTGYPGSIGALLAGSRTLTSEANDAVDGLAALVRDDPELAARLTGPGADSPVDLAALAADFPEFGAAVADVLARYGHRETTVLLMTMPTWKDAPEELLGLVASLAAAPERAGAPHATDAPDAVAALLADPVLGHRLVRPLVHRLVRVARTLFQIREDTHFLATASLPTARRVVREFGRRLVQLGIADDVEDVYHLRRPELAELVAGWPPDAERAGRARRIIERRRAKRAELAGTPYVAPPPLAGAAGDDVLVQGLAASAGVAEGPVRLVHGPPEFARLAAGEVLVAPYTTPSWTPLFRRAAAVVADVGGPASHAAITAREYGLPAVLGAGDATRRLHDGQWVRVDGGSGLVTTPDAAPDGTGTGADRRAAARGDDRGADAAR